MRDDWNIFDATCHAKMTTVFDKNRLCLKHFNIVMKLFLTENMVVIAID